MLNPVEAKDILVCRYDDPNTQIDIIFKPRVSSPNEYVILAWRDHCDNPNYNQQTSVYINEYFDLDEKLQLVEDLRNSANRYHFTREKHTYYNLMADSLLFAIYFLED